MRFCMMALVLAACCVGAEADDGKQADELAEPAKSARPARVFAPVEGRIEIHSSTHDGVRGISKSRRTVNGVTTIEVREGRNITRILEHPEEGISVETSKAYNQSNMEEIKDSHPNVYAYLERAPRGMGPTKFRVTVEVAQVFQATSADELKKNHPKAFEIYQRHAGDDLRPRFPALPRPEFIPRFRPVPKEVPPKVEPKKKPMSEIET